MSMRSIECKTCTRCVLEVYFLFTQETMLKLENDNVLYISTFKKAALHISLSIDLKFSKIFP